MLITMSFSNAFLIQISEWVTEMEQLVKQQRGSGRSMQAHLASLKVYSRSFKLNFWSFSDLSHEKTFF